MKSFVAHLVSYCVFNSDVSLLIINFFIKKKKSVAIPFSKPSKPQIASQHNPYLTYLNKQNKTMNCLFMSFSKRMNWIRGIY